MDPKVFRLLLDLNRRFYSDFGRAFAATRQRVQPGVARALGRLPKSGPWLDLGCGSGQLARALARMGFEQRYLGLDSSTELLAEARQVNLGNSYAVFRCADLADSGWADGLESGAWAVVTCFAVLHHLPGIELRAQVLRQIRLLLAEGGLFAHSVWQFQRSPRLMARRQPWERVGLRASDVEEGDALLDWRYALPGQSERTGLRYVHLFSREELAHLAEMCGFMLVEEYESDGAGGALSLYQLWQGI